MFLIIKAVVIDRTVEITRYRFPDLYLFLLLPKFIKYVLDNFFSRHIILHQGKSIRMHSSEMLLKKLLECCFVIAIDLVGIYFHSVLFYRLLLRKTTEGKFTLIFWGVFFVRYKTIVGEAISFMFDIQTHQ